MEYEEWWKMYHTEKKINVREVLDDEDYAVLDKLGIKIKDSLYTGVDYERLSLEIGAYYEDDNMTEEELIGFKELSKVGVSKKEYERLLKKFEVLDKMFLLTYMIKVL